MVIFSNTLKNLISRLKLLFSKLYKEIVCTSSLCLLRSQNIYNLISGKIKQLNFNYLTC